MYIQNNIGGCQLRPDWNGNIIWHIVAQELEQIAKEMERINEYDN